MERLGCRGVTATSVALLFALVWLDAFAAPAHAGGAKHRHAGNQTLFAAASSGAGSVRTAVSLTGRMERVHGHRSGDRRAVAGWLLVTRGGRRIPLTFAPRVSPRPAARVRVRGKRRGANVHVASLQRIAGGAAARAAAAPTGAKRTAVVLFNFTDDRSQPFSPDQARTALFTGPRSVSAFYSAESGQRLSLTGRDRPDGDVYGWYEIDSSGTECFGGDSWDWYSKAEKAVTDAGGSLAGYDHVVFAHPQVSSCAFSGIATLGGAWSSLNGSVDLWLAGHEIGHNYEFEHAGKAYCRDAGGRPVAISRSCVVGEYDDPYDIMGNRFQRHSSGVLQLQAGWIGPAAAQTVTASGSYDIAPLTSSDDRVRVLRVPRSDGRSYWLEFRRPHGIFDDFSLTEPVVSGVSIRLARGPHSPEVTQLIDTNPESSRWTRDEALTAGRTFEDAEHEISITTDSVTSTSARVSVRLGPAPAAAPAPDPAPPPAPEPTPEPTPTPAPTGSVPPSSPPARGPADADGDTAARATVRTAPRRAVIAGRTVAARRLARADGRTVTVAARHWRQGLVMSFGRTAALATGTATVKTRLRSSPGCSPRISVRAPRGRWHPAADIAARTRARDFEFPLPSAWTGRRLDIRAACRAPRRLLVVDAVTVVREAFPRARPSRARGVG